MTLLGCYGGTTILGNTHLFFSPPFFFGGAFNGKKGSETSLHRRKVPNAGQDHIGQLGPVPAKARNDLGR